MKQKEKCSDVKEVKKELKEHEKKDKKRFKQLDFGKKKK